MNSNPACRTQAPSLNTTIKVLLLIAVGTFLRLYKLNGQPLWMDEVASVANAQAFESGGIRALARVDRVAPLHNLILWASIRMFGAGALAVRLPSVFAGVLAIPLSYLLGMRLFGSRRTAMVAAALVALSPFAVWYSQEARMYAVLLLMACVYVLAVWPIVEGEQKPASWLLVTVVSVLSFYTHHYMLLLSAAFGIFLLTQKAWTWKRAWIWLGTQVIAFVLFAVWLILTSEQLGSQTAFSKPAILLWTPYTLYSFVVGQSLGPGVRELRVDGAHAAVFNHLPSVILPAIAIAALLAYAIRLVSTFKVADRGALAYRWLWIWLIVPIALAIAATFVTKVQYNVRYSVVSYPAMVLLMSLAITRGFENRLAGIWRKGAVASTVVIAVASAVSLYNWYFNPAYAKEEVRPLAQLLDADHSDKLLVLDNSRIATVLAYYDAKVPARTIEVDNAIWGRTPADAINELKSTDRSATSGDVWLVEYRSWETDSEGSIARDLDGSHELIQQMTWPGVILRKYRPRAPRLATD